MEVDIYKMKKMLEERYFLAEVFRNEEKTSVSIEYGPRLEMRVNGLRPDFPPYLRFERGRIFYSENGSEWREVDKNLGFQIFHLLDPRLLLERVSNIREFWTVSQKGFKGEYALDEMKLNLPDQVMVWLKKVKEDIREVRFFIRSDGLIDSMVQKDIPPNSEMITLKFQYP